MKKSVISTILLLSLLLSTASSLISCGEKNDDNKNNNSGDVQNSNDDANSDESDTGEETQSLFSMLTPVDMDGYEFSANVRSSSTGNGGFACYDFYTEEMNADQINDAVYQRNEVIESTYKCKIVQNLSIGNQLTEISNAVSADVPYEAGVVLATACASLAQQGLLLDMCKMGAIDFTQPYWDSNAYEAFNICGARYFMTGDLNLSTFDCTRMSVFSKNLIETNFLDNPYDLVREGKWTLSKYFEMALVANKDLNGDGKYGTSDQIGYYVYMWDPEYLFFGSGERISKTNSEGYPEIVIYNDRSINVLEQIYDICKNARTDTVGGASRDQVAMFTEDRCLFTQTSMWDARRQLRDNCENDFGMLPIPKYEEEQERYYNYCGFNDTTHLWCVPVSCSNQEYAGIIIEAFAKLSAVTTRYAYYDVTMQGKVARDKDSTDMLNIIFSTRIYDMAAMYNWGNWCSWLQSLVQKVSFTFASDYKKSTKVTEKQLGKTIKAFEELNKNQ